MSRHRKDPYYAFLATACKVAMCHFNRLVDVPKLLYYADSSNGRPGFGATVKMESGETYSVSFAHNGVLVKKTRFGIFGPKIYEVEDFGEMVEMVEKLNDLFPETERHTG